MIRLLLEYMDMYIFTEYGLIKDKTAFFFHFCELRDRIALILYETRYNKNTFANLLHGTLQQFLKFI